MYNIVLDICPIPSPRANVLNHARQVVTGANDTMRNVMATNTIVSNTVIVTNPTPPYLPEVLITQRLLGPMLIPFAPNGSVNETKVVNQRMVKATVATRECAYTPLARKRNRAALVGTDSAPNHARARKTFAHSRSDFAIEIPGYENEVIEPTPYYLLMNRIDDKIVPNVSTLTVECEYRVIIHICQLTEKARILGSGY